MNINAPVRPTTKSRFGYKVDDLNVTPRIFATTVKAIYLDNYRNEPTFEEGHVYHRNMDIEDRIAFWQNVEDATQQEIMTMLLHRSGDSIISQEVYKRSFLPQILALYGFVKEALECHQYDEVLTQDHPAIIITFSVILTNPNRESFEDIFDTFNNRFTTKDLEMNFFSNAFINQGVEEKQDGITGYNRKGGVEWSSLTKVI